MKLSEFFNDSTNNYHIKADFFFYKKTSTPLITAIVLFRKFIAIKFSASVVYNVGLILLIFVFIFFSSFIYLNLHFIYNNKIYVIS